MTAVGFEPTPLRTGAWSQRLRPLGQTVLEAVHLPFGEEGTECPAGCRHERRGAQQPHALLPPGAPADRAHHGTQTLPPLRVAHPPAQATHGTRRSVPDFRQRQSPYRLVVRTSRRGRDNPGSTPGVDIFATTPTDRHTDTQTHRHQHT